MVRADNYGWGASYEGNAGLTTVCDAQNDWASWLAAMDEALVTVSVTNCGDGTANVKCVMVGNDGNTYNQEYNGIAPVDAEDLSFRFTVDDSHLVFE